ncbi:MAG: alanine dehydrogenase [Chloroflexaceae bacterium]|nr:alanine dehydrogenase [Chloroflexaceae bacterium]
MIIGVPKETKDRENRVAVTPGGVRELVEAGHQVLVETGAGVGSGFTNQQYVAVGAQIVPEAADAWAAEMVVKVKEPLPAEYEYLRAGLLLFTYLHLAAAEDLTHELLQREVLGIAYETVELSNGTLPLLTPMSEVAGRMAVQVGAYYMMKTNGGIGKLIGGVPGVLPASVLILGGGVVGINAAKMALGMGANVTIFDRDLDRLRYLDDVLDGRINTISSNALRISEAITTADLVVGAVLIKGARAPKLVTHEMIGTMQPGSVLVDVAVDQGGCFETTHATTHSNPIFLVDDVIHYCVANMPGAVPNTSTRALNNATLPYMLKLANMGAEAAVKADPTLAKGVNTYRGAMTYPAVAEAFGLEYTPLTALV